jgi:hypothetical protein
MGCMMEKQTHTYSVSNNTLFQLSAYMNSQAGIPHSATEYHYMMGWVFLWLFYPFSEAILPPSLEHKLQENLCLV